MRHYVLTTSGDIVVCVLFVIGQIIYTQGKTKLSRKSENAVADDRVLKFFYDANVESSARSHRKYKNGRIKVDLG